MQYIANFTENLLDTDSISSSNSSRGINQLNNPNHYHNSSSSGFSKPYNSKNNFSTVTKIDKQFKKAEKIVDHAYFFQKNLMGMIFYD